MNQTLNEELNNLRVQLQESRDECAKVNVEVKNSNNKMTQMEVGAFLYKNI